MTTSISPSPSSLSSATDAPATLAAHAGSDPARQHGLVNPAVWHGSTVLFPTVAAMRAASKDRFSGVVYGRYGTPTQHGLEEAVAALEGGYGSVLVSSGLAAVTTALLACVKGGDHVVVVDCAYAPTRKFCDTILKGFGVETTYVPACLGADVVQWLRPETRVVMIEPPGSHSFEMQDIPAIAAALRTARPTDPPLLLSDSTWATPIGWRAFELGIDLSIHAGTKYIVGHSDAMLGVIVARTEPLWRQVKETAAIYGQCVGPDDAYLGLRGLRTLPARLPRHQETAAILQQWLAERPEVARILSPAWPADPGHLLWKRDFLAGCGLFGIVLHPVAEVAVHAMLDGMRLFKLGFSWGGYESLMVPSDLRGLRTLAPAPGPGPMLRIHAGLEAPKDLIADLDAGFARMAAAARVAA